MIVNIDKGVYKVIRIYKGLLGDILVEEWEEKEGFPEYHVRYEGCAVIGRYFTRDKVDAISYAQFIAAKY